MNTFRLCPTTRVDGQVLDVLIDDLPLAHYFAGRLGSIPDYVSPLGWATDEQYNQNQYRRFLLEKEPDLPNGRNSVLICPIDGDLLCGAYSAVFGREENSVSWSQFAYECPDFMTGTQAMTFYEQIPTFSFSWEQYESELLKRILP